MSITLTLTLQVWMLIPISITIVLFGTSVIEYSQSGRRGDWDIPIFIWVVMMAMILLTRYLP
jgi:hypothetical protein